MVSQPTIPRMDANTARTENMRRLVAEAGGPAEWARRFGHARWQQAQVSQWISEAKPKGIGRNLARDLEAAMGLAPGELDRQESGPSQDPRLERAIVEAAVKLVRELDAMSPQPPPPETYATRLYLAMLVAREEGAAAILEGQDLVGALRRFAAELRKAG
ncbi:hypothetical protein KV692_05360 [Xanthomonas euvesicatoria pv. physalidis]|nr:hypothetical protein [Xanthomonas euvesicatoria pv. physalidis]